MVQETQQGLYKRRALSESEVLQVKQLAQACTEYEALHMPIFWSGLLRSSDADIKNFLYYVDSELVGYFVLDERDPVMSDGMGMVHPAHRRQGLFRQLLHAAAQECGLRDQTGLVITCAQGSRSGQACMRAIATAHIVSEYEMLLTDFRQGQFFDERLTLRKAESSELATLVKVQATTFRAPEDITRLRVQRHTQNPHSAYYLMTYGEEFTGCQEPVGILRLDESEDGFGIYSLGILPDYQTRGYGRQLLEEAIRTVDSYSHKPIYLFVDMRNIRAVNLYRSCGFTVRTSYDYYFVGL